MGTEKIPEADGLPAEFYKVFLERYICHSYYPSKLRMHAACMKMFLHACKHACTLKCMHADTYCMHADTYCMHAEAYCMHAGGYCMHADTHCLHTEIN